MLLAMVYFSPLLVYWLYMVDNIQLNTNMKVCFIIEYWFGFQFLLAR